MDPFGERKVGKWRVSALAGLPRQRPDPPGGAAASGRQETAERERRRDLTGADVRRPPEA